MSGVLGPGDFDEVMLALAQANALLDDVLAYLARLPAVPVTRQFIERVSDARQEPAAALLRHRAEMARRAAVTLGWTKWNGLGEPVLDVTLEDETLKLGSTGISKRPQAARELLELVDRGLVLKLQEMQRR